MSKGSMKEWGRQKIEKEEQKEPLCQYQVRGDGGRLPTIFCSKPNSDAVNILKTQYSKWFVLEMNFLHKLCESSRRKLFLVISCKILVKSSGFVHASKMLVRGKCFCIFLILDPIIQLQVSMNVHFHNFLKWNVLMFSCSLK